MPSGVGADNWMSSAVRSVGAAASTCGSGGATAARRRFAGHVSTRASSDSRTSASDSPVNQASHSAGSPAAVRPRMGIAVSVGVNARGRQRDAGDGAASSISPRRASIAVRAAG